MIITGAVAEWEQWTGMALPESGQYVVPDGLDLVDIDREKTAEYTPRPTYGCATRLHDTDHPDR